jgi:hypothetical protein
MGMGLKVRWIGPSLGDVVHTFASARKVPWTRPYLLTLPVCCAAISMLYFGVLM